MKSQDNLSPELEHYIASIKATSPSSVEDEKMQLKLDAVIKEQSELAEHVETTGKRSRSILGKLKQKLSQVSLVPLGGAVATLTLGVITLLLLNGPPRVAFASVVQQLEKITSMRFVSEMKAFDSVFSRLKVYYQEPGLIRVETIPLTEGGENASSINVINTKKGQGVIFFPGPKFATPFNFDPKQAEDSPKDDPLYWFTAIKQYKGDVTQLGEQVINNKTATGLTFKESGTQVTLWIDPSTQLPIKIIVSTAGENNETAFQMEADVEFNLVLEDQLFSLDIGDNYKQRKENE
ncbi:hypothetical protein Q4489_01835 [Thalassotalea sp. 1_MG-2023]|uniref:LolA family protein n=1 Tax=Thalassotalea sp. 1_MG-2023 TaxID=3062680 RepID=UPI0026E134FA|nr:hypothetical protein [Thalassotalea sp. 1_MG-2023]MDO6425729.1 hypothetical protein [Thalassotalea sp. 1_MG-2023]